MCVCLYPQGLGFRLQVLLDPIDVFLEADLDQGALGRPVAVLHRGCFIFKKHMSCRVCVLLVSKTTRRRRRNMEEHALAGAFAAEASAYQHIWISSLREQTTTRVLMRPLLTVRWKLCVLIKRLYFVFTCHGCSIRHKLTNRLTSPFFSSGSTGPRRKFCNSLASESGVESRPTSVTATWLPAAHFPSAPVIRAVKAALWLADCRISHFQKICCHFTLEDTEQHTWLCNTHYCATHIIILSLALSSPQLILCSNISTNIRVVCSH